MTQNHKNIYVSLPFFSFENIAYTFPVKKIVKSTNFSRVRDSQAKVTVYKRSHATCKLKKSSLSPEFSPKNQKIFSPSPLETKQKETL